MTFLDKRRIAVVVTGFAAMLNLYAPQAVLPLMAQEFGVSPARISMVMAASAFAVALTAPFTGAIADVLGRKRVISAAMVMLIVPDVMIALSPGLDALVFWRFVQGLLLPPIFAVCVAYIGGEWPRDEATGMTGVFITSTAVGGFAGRLLTGVLAEPVGWRNAFLADAAITALCALAVMLLLPRERLFVKAVDFGASLRQMVQHLRDPLLLGTFAVGFGIMFSFISAFTYVSFLLAAPPFNLSAAALGLIFVVYLISIVTTPQSGRLVAWLGRRRAGLIVIGIWICGIMLTLLPSLTAIIAGLTIAAACGFFIQTCSQSFVTVTAKAGVSSALGLYVTAFYAGGSIGAFLPGLVWDSGGWPATVALIVTMLAIMAAMIALAWRNDTVRH